MTVSDSVLTRSPQARASELVEHDLAVGGPGASEAAEVPAARAAASPPAPHGPRDGDGAGTTEHPRVPEVGVDTVLRLLIGLVWLFYSSRMYVGTYTVPLASAMTVAFSLGSALVLVTAVARPGDRAPRWLDPLILVGTLVGLGAWIASLVYTSSDYGTDEAAFVQGAASLLLSGQNPYGADLAPFLQQFGVSPSSLTTTLEGGFVRDLGYPALSFLPLVPALALGLSTQALVWVNLAFFCAGAVLLWLVLPPRLRTAVPLLISFDAYGSSLSSGLIFGLALPFAVLAVWRWDRFAVPTSTLERWGSPLLLGLACCVRQDAWFLVPFLSVGVAVEARRAGLPGVRRGLTYLGLVAAVFLGVNLPFLLWDPAAFLVGVLGPVVHGLVPLGQGVVGLTLYLGLGGGSLTLFSATAGLTVLALLVASLGWYEQLKRLVPVFPAVVLLLSSRSLSQYLLFAVLTTLVALATVGPARPQAAGAAPVPSPRVVAWARRGALALGGAAVLALGGALLAPAPLDMTLAGTHTTGQQGTVDEVVVDVRNTAGHDAEPVFVVGAGPYVGTPWLRAEGPERLGAGERATYRLLAPNVYAMPGVSSGFRVYAFTESRASVSSTAVTRLGAVSTRLSPAAVDRVVAPDEVVDMSVQLLDRLGKPVRRADVEVALGQAQYTPNGLLAGEASVNGSAAGASPVVATTDGQGVARFAVSAPAEVAHAVFFQAWLVGDAPSGYSSQVSVWFGSSAEGRSAVVRTSAGEG